MSLKRGIGPRSTSPLMSLGLYLRASDCENAWQVGRGTPAPRRSQARLRSNENHPADGIIIRPKSRALFQQHRPKADIGGSGLLSCKPLNPISLVACNELSLARGLVNLLKEKNTGTSAIRMTQRVPVLT